jgi:acetylornithine deacetylase/succinyl-diaminopimelate desuccinylase-like protein
MVPTVSRTTSLNVGRLGGGEAINARARQGWFDLELRGADLAALDELEAKARAVLEGPVGAEMNVKVTDVGRRPAGRISPEHPLVVAAREALQARAIPWRQVASSTDANAAHAVGLPAVALGVTYGANEHTPQEWVEILPIADGLAALADTVVRYEHLKLSPTARRSSARPPSAARSRGEGEGP